MKGSRRAFAFWGLYLAGLSGCSSTEEEPRAALTCEEADLAERDAEELFAAQHVPRFDLEMKGSSWSSRRQRARDEEYEPAVACYDGQRIGEVGMRFKGQVGTLERCFEDDVLICPKLSLRLKFDEYVDGQRFFGLKRLNLHSMRSDDSHLRERLAYDLYRAADVDAPRSSWAELVVDGKSQGLFAMVEQIDGRFTSSRWPEDGEGDLYKEAWPTAVDPEFYRERLETDEDRAQPELLASFAADYLATPAESRLDLLRKRADVDQLLRLLAVDDAIFNWDGITTFYEDNGHNHNFFISLANQALGADGFSFRIIPWDMDNTFRVSTWISSAPNWRKKIDDCPRVVLGTRVAGCDPILAALAEDEAGYRAAAHALLAGPFQPGDIERAVDAHVTRLRPVVERDQFGPSIARWERDIASLRADLPRLRDRLARLADGPPIESVALSPSGVTDFSSIDALEAEIGIFLASGAGVQLRSEISPADSPLSGIRLVFQFDADSERWAFFALGFDATEVDLRGKTGIRFKARARELESARVQLNEHGAPIGAPRWEWDLAFSEDATTHELYFDEATLDGGARTIESALQKIESIGMTVLSDGAASGYIELDDFEIF